eukprot:2414682-Amphidinium_carterae.1
MPFISYVRGRIIRASHLVLQCVRHGDTCLILVGWSAAWGENHAFASTAAPQLLDGTAVMLCLATVENQNGYGWDPLALGN